MMGPFYTKQLETTVTTSLGQEKKTESSSLFLFFFFPTDALPRLNIASGESAVEDDDPTTPSPLLITLIGFRE